MMKSMDDNNNSNFSLGFSLSPNMKMGFPGYADVNFSSGFHNHPSQFSVMPIKSDGSLCIMEALSRSQPQASSPKLENFLGSERETMPLSLDSIYYQQQITTEDQEELNRQQQQHSIEAFQQQQQQQQNQHYYSTGSLINGCSAQISQIPTWASRSYSTQHVMEHPQMGNANLTDITQISSTEVDCLSMETKKRGIGKVGQKQTVHRKSIDTFGQRTSQYRGVTKHRWTGRYEAHLWDNSCKKEGQTRKGRQVYLGGYDMEEKAARSYDLAALKYWGPSTHINFPLENYKDQLEEMKNMTRQEFVAHLRRKSSGFSRGASMYRGVTRHHQHGRWQARIGRVAGNKDLYLGTFSTQEEAAEAYDIAAIKFRGANAVTNFDITRYDVEKIMSSNTLLASEQAKRIKAFDHIASPQINGDPNNSNSDWKMVLSDHFPQQQQLTDTHHKQESMISVGNYQGSNFLQDMIGTNSLSSASDSNKMGSVQFSNASSIVTSLNSSREGSPADKSGSSPNINMLFPMAPVSWISPPTAIPMSHLPVYAAWTDA